MNRVRDDFPPEMRTKFTEFRIRGNRGALAAAPASFSGRFGASIGRALDFRSDLARSLATISLKLNEQNQQTPVNTFAEQKLGRRTYNPSVSASQSRQQLC